MALFVFNPVTWAGHAAMQVCAPRCKTKREKEGRDKQRTACFPYRTDVWHVVIIQTNVIP